RPDAGGWIIELSCGCRIAVVTQVPRNECLSIGKQCCRVKIALVNQIASNCPAVLGWVVEFYATEDVNTIGSSRKERPAIGQQRRSVLSAGRRERTRV